MNQKEMDYLASLGPIMPADVKPVHVGWYAREYEALADPLGRGSPWLLSRDYWNGKFWQCGGPDGNKGSITSALRWRGLAEQPKRISTDHDIVEVRPQQQQLFIPDGFVWHGGEGKVDDDEGSMGAVGVALLVLAVLAFMGLIVWAAPRIIMLVATH